MLNGGTGELPVMLEPFAPRVQPTSSGRWSVAGNGGPLSAVSCPLYVLHDLPRHAAGFEVVSLKQLTTGHRPPPQRMRVVNWTLPALLGATCERLPVKTQRTCVTVRS